MVNEIRVGIRDNLNNNYYHWTINKLMYIMNYIELLSEYYIGVLIIVLNLGELYRKNI